MTKEYIDREAVLNLCNEMIAEPWNLKTAPASWADAYSAFKDIVEYLPAADVVEVRHGRWIQPHWKNSNYCCNCSECGREAMHADYQWDKKGIYPLCPHCGAIMDL